MNIEHIDHGVTGNVHLWEVIDADTGKTIGWVQTEEPATE